MCDLGPNLHVSMSLHSDRRHVDWVRSYLSVWTEMQSYIKQHHTTGLVWSKSVSISANIFCHLYKKIINLVLDLFFKKKSVRKQHFATVIVFPLGSHWKPGCLFVSRLTAMRDYFVSTSIFSDGALRLYKSLQSA